MTSTGVDIAAVSNAISGLGKRQFLIRKAGKNDTEQFGTRWARSYLRGPMTRDQIAAVMKAAPAVVPTSQAQTDAATRRRSRPNLKSPRSRTHAGAAAAPGAVTPRPCPTRSPNPPPPTMRPR